MKNLLKIILLILISLILFNKSAYALSNKDIDITRKCSISINYDNIFDNKVIRLYHIASLNSNLECQMNSNYNELLIDINNNNDNNLLYIIDKLNKYIEDNDIDEDIIKDIDNKKIVINNLNLGLYFIKTTNKNNTKTYSSSLINIPNNNIDNIVNYDIEIFPKLDSSNIDSNPITLDNISNYIYIFIGSLISIILLIIIYKRYN